MPETIWCKINRTICFYEKFELKCERKRVILHRPLISDSNPEIYVHLELMGETETSWNMVRKELNSLEL